MRHESSPGGTAQQQQKQRTVLESANDERRVEDASPLVTTEAEALASARVLCQLHADTLASPTARGTVGVHMPVFAVSAVTGAGLPVLHAFLNALQSAAPLKAACHTPLATAGSSSGLQSSATTGASVSVGADSSCDGISSCDGTSAGGSPRAAAGSVGFNNLDAPAVAAAAAAAAAAAGPQQQLLYAPAAAAVATAMATAAAIPAESQAVHFQVDGTFEVEGVGSVVSGTLVSGMVHVGQELLLGPTAAGDFTRVVVRQLQRSHVQVKQVRAGQTCTIAISPAVASLPAVPSAAATVAANGGGFSGGEELLLGTSPGMGPMAAAAAPSVAADGKHRISSSGFEDALAAAQTALELCLAGESDDDDGGAEDDLFGFDASDGPASPPARRAKVASPQPTLGAGPQPTFRDASFGEGTISFSTSLCDLHSTTSFCVGGGTAASLAATSGSGAAATTLSTSAPPPRICSLGATPSPFSGVASRSKGAVLLEPALQPRTSWTFEAVLILLGGHWPPRGLVSGRWPPAGDDEVDAAMLELQSQLEPRCLDAQSASELQLQRSSSSNDPPTSGQSGSMTPASTVVADGSEVAIGEQVVSDGSGAKRGADLLVGALSDVCGGDSSCGASGVAAVAMRRENEDVLSTRVLIGGSRKTAADGEKPGCRRRRQRAGTACSYVTVVHCGSVRQPAQVLMVQELMDDGQANEQQPDGGSSPYSCPDLRISASTRAAAALLHSASVTFPAGQLHPPATATEVSSISSSLSSWQQQAPQQPLLDHDLGCLVRVVFRWQHRPEWLREGAKLLVRDRGDGRVAGAGFVRRVLF
ncbi:hypothetical protein Vretimale_13205 [Volvox reticuliferus]|nr:hypothetical protein Vretifemale_14233 [Volvox reticuliferus]GIM09299.1 hypothetical protein Vretimale_13205 [Volvox reticuliferus]